MKFEINKTIDGFIEVDQSVTLVVNLLETSVYLIKSPRGRSHRVYRKLGSEVRKGKKVDIELGKCFHLYHHGIVPHERTGFKDIIRIAPGLEYKFKDEKFNYVGEALTDDIWGSDNKEKVESFKYDISDVVSNSDAEATLFSGGIDSLMLAIFDKEKRPLLHFNNDPIQKIVATALAEVLERPLKIVEPSDFDESDLQLAFNLRKNGLGHYLPWNNGATFSEYTYNKKLISGQHADTLLMVDTFAPGINSHGLYWYLRMISSIKKRVPYTLTQFGNLNLRVKMLNLSIDNLDEHVELSGEKIERKSPIQNETVRALLQEKKLTNSEFVQYAKLLKKYRFCINANRIYNEVEDETGYVRDLIYYNPRIQKHLISYLPSTRDCFHPKSLFYDIVKDWGIDYYSFKRRLLKPIINTKYFYDRYKSKKIHHQTDIAMKHIRWHASKMGLDIKDLLVMLEIQEKDKFTKSDLMIMDRRLNFLQYIA